MEFVKFIKFVELVKMMKFAKFMELMEVTKMMKLMKIDGIGGIDGIDENDVIGKIPSFSPILTICHNCFHFHAPLKLLNIPINFHKCHKFVEISQLQSISQI